MKQSLSRAEARRIALAAQGFARGRGSGSAGTRQLNDTIRRMGVLQIDSVNVFARSHYMPLFARLGAYDTSTLDRLLFRARAPYTEYWAHVAAFIPIEDRPLFGFRMHDMRDYLNRDGGWAQSNPQALDAVRAELASRGPLRPAQFEQPARRAGTGWWDWNDVKHALEHLWLTGEVAIAGRRGFERVYGLAADVLPAAALDRDMPRRNAMRELIGRAARAYGVATVADLDDYWRFRDQRGVAAVVAELEDAGELIPVQVEGWMRGGKLLPAWVHRDAKLPRRVDAAALLTPFDPLVWFRDRAERLFDFDYRIEIYTPAPKRRFGYYSLPALIGDDVVGRVDLKADRASSTLRVQSAWWEHAHPPDAAERLAAELRTAARWQGLESVSVSGWGDAVDDLAQAIPDALRHERAG